MINRTNVSNDSETCIPMAHREPTRTRGELPVQSQHPELCVVTYMHIKVIKQCVRLQATVGPGAEPPCDSQLYLGQGIAPSPPASLPRCPPLSAVCVGGEERQESRLGK